MEPSCPTAVDDDSVVFELPTPEHAADLFDRLASGRHVWTLVLDEGALLVAEPHTAPDLVEVLRTVERWVADRQLGAIRYWLDAKQYLLQAEVEWSAVELVEGAR
jgi:hypothetical protein